MQEAIINLGSPERIHEIFRSYKSNPPTGWWYRGQSKVDWDLIPKAGRKEYFCNDSAYGRFLSWSKKAYAHDKNLPGNDWERLAIAQHHGLATCLLDWTYNPLVALHFACREFLDTDGAVYCYDPIKYIDENVMKIKGLRCSGYALTPRSISPRFVNQRGAFTVHIPANQGPEIVEHPQINNHPNLIKIVIESKLKPELARMLDQYGINDATLFPDLDGLSRYINWETERIVKGEI